MFIAPEAHAFLRRSEVRAEDILITITGNVGRIVYLDGLLGTANINQHIARVRITAPDVDTKFVYHWLSQKSVRKHYDSITTGQAYPQISLQQVRGTSVPIPPLEEQRAIAVALSDVDALIAALDKLVAKKHAIKTAVMQRLLTRKQRLPGFSREWEEKRLGDVLEKILGGGTPSRSNSRFWGNEIPWVTVKDFATFHPRQTQEAITWEGLKQSASNLIPKGTLITSTRMALGKTVIYEVDVSINQDLKALFPKPNVSARFLYYWFEHHAHLIDELGSGSTVKGIALADLKGLEFRLAPLGEQTAIAAVLSDMDAEIAALEARREKTQAIKQGMMQELLTGRTRLV